MAIDTSDIVNIITKLGGTTTLIEVEEALIAVDQVVIEEEEKARFAVTIWDRISDINGVSAEQIIASRHDIPEEGDIYLVYLDGKVVYFQPHEPNQEGCVAIPVGEAENKAVSYMDKLVQERVDQRVHDFLVQHFLNDGVSQGA